MEFSAFPLTLAQFDMPWKKRRRAAAVQDAVRDTMIPEIREASWSAPALWRYASRRGIREFSA
jgi:hypothetical protein